MSIIKSHDITLYGGNENNIVLRPLRDEHLPLLYKWNADPELVYWADSGNADVFSQEAVRGIYRNVSKNALCFLAELDGLPIGDFWLQRMNINEVSDRYPQKDVRRIDAAIGEKTLWGKGIGTTILGMLIDYAFNGEYVDLLYCFAADYNIRSQKTLLKHGFVLTNEEALGEDSLRAKKEFHYTLSRQEYISLRRVKVPVDNRFDLPIDALQPSQLYISSGKLQLVNEWFKPDDRNTFDPIPVKYFGGNILMTDGHTRAVAACLAGWRSVPVYEDLDELDIEAYAKNIEWCRSEAINNPYDLTKRIISHKDYEKLWRRRCKMM